MSGFVQWNEVPNRGGGQAEFLALKSGNTYKIRPLFKPLNFYKYFHKVDGKLRTAIVSEEIVSQLSAMHPELNKPANRYAMYVLDRNDDNKVKIMEFSVSVFKNFSNRFQLTGEEPGSNKNGSDWAIKVSGSGFSTVYETTFIKNTPLTNDEVEAVKTELGGDMEKLATIFKFLDLKSAEKKLFESGEDDNSHNSPSVSNKSTVKVSSELEIDNDDDISDSVGDFNPDW